MSDILPTGPNFLNYAQKLLIFYTQKLNEIRLNLKSTNQHWTTSFCNRPHHSASTRLISFDFTFIWLWLHFRFRDIIPCVLSFKLYDVKAVTEMKKRKWKLSNIVFVASIKSCLVKEELLLLLIYIKIY